MYKQLIQECASVLKIYIDDNKLSLLSDYCTSIASDGVQKGFTNIKGSKDIVDRHIGESLFLVQCINKYANGEKANLIDIGTGAGIPGIILGIINANYQVDLLDANKKKSLFVEGIIQSLELSNFNSINQRVEDFAKEQKNIYKYAVSKAVAPLSILMEYAMPLLTINGLLFSPKGSESRNEVNNVENASKELGCEIIDVIEFPKNFTENNQAIIIVKKFKKTPNRFPRKSGIAIKRPL
ncbi:MAG: 16S rRNA (guanine(527)-N(7))-methyltransferase RsmG [Chloroflexi bacterium]|nr:16S rRNA (guanine(527)-N(7))-methyltransferase RsmG [Chloroflexota bacterium]